MKNLLKIYDIFKTGKNLKETESFNDISKATKKILTNKKKFRNYFVDYGKQTEVYSFKSPGITKYPLLKRKSCALLPVQKTKMTFYEDLKEKKKETEKIDLSQNKRSKFIIDTSRDSFYKKKMKQNITKSKLLFKNRLIFMKKAKYLNNKIQRYNSLFMDFFYKWNKDKTENDIYMHQENNKDNNIDVNNSDNYTQMNNNNINDGYKHIINDKYSELKYDDNLIFNSNYTHFTNERLDFILLNNIENVETKLESKFNDLKNNEIKLRLESIKINFTPVRNKINALSKFPLKENENTTKKTVLYIPLYFAFIFCIKDIDFFKYILLSCINFSEKDKIIFDESKIKPALKGIFNLKKEVINKGAKENNLRSSGILHQINKKNVNNYRKAVSKVGVNYRKFSVKKKGMSKSNINTSNSSTIFNMARNSILEDFTTNFKKNQKKEVIIHSNPKNNNYSNNDEEELIKGGNKRKVNLYDEYVFIWETNNKTYFVSMQMPIIYFNYKNLKEEIATYCDKTLFLYMYKNNFINWDFYSLNFLFSLKVFRKKILQNYSLAKNNIIFHNNNLEQILKINNYLPKKTETIKIVKAIKTNASMNDIKIQKDENEEITIINKDTNKIYNIINGNNESYIFFYTDETYQNTLIKVYSYLINIDYDKLNPNIRWKYMLNFKLMKILNEITKYEPLETFFPKIIKTDFQNGRLLIDFSIFDNFSIDILEYEKKDLIKNNSNIMNNKNENSRNKLSGVISSYTKENEELCIDIKFPSLKQEKIFNELDGKISFKKKNTDLHINFLQNLNKFKMERWSQKILEEIHKQENPALYSNKNIAPNFPDKNNNINDINNNNITPGIDESNQVNNNKKYVKSTSYNYSEFDKKGH